MYACDWMAESESESERVWHFLLFKWIFHYFIYCVIHHFELFLSLLDPFLTLHWKWWDIAKLHLASSLFHFHDLCECAMYINVNSWYNKLWVKMAFTKQEKQEDVNPGSRINLLVDVNNIVMRAQSSKHDGKYTLHSSFGFES